MKLSNAFSAITAFLGAATACYMLVSYVHLSPPLPLTDPRSDSIGNVQGSIYYYIPAVLIYSFLAWRYIKKSATLPWYTRAGVALLSIGIAGVAILLAMHRGEVEAIFFLYTLFVAVICSLIAFLMPLFFKKQR
ncbi:hypothetical protein AB9P05_01420 [Roseivirga sp. BDSF3-8]|uniref:hypothetical protein n=1 Tax=Roseivirga sp. BDSF3-8 TaxID=3241598 RepID=UPI0035320C6C